ncbi:MAG TPA: efflux RND transporter periplasmic adaptor subunit [Sphingobacteriaceae bacterium]|nr:efflux RND transporter periplasmic adaptor subunit [Sphingobacteriaceae bacterium]
MQLGNIKLDTIRNGFIGNQLVLTGTLNFDQTKINAVSARLSGRIEKLYFKKIGDYVSKGAPLYEIYSEELNNAKQEYVAAIEKKQLLDNSLIDFDRLIQSAKNKLLLWGMSEVQISQLPKGQKVSPTTTFYSTANGYITSLDITEGGYVSEGGSIVRLADLSALWAEAQLYSSQRSYIDPKAIAVVSFPDISGKLIKGKMDFENPELSPDSRINLIRVSIPNPGNQLKPGMSAYVTVKSQAAGSSLSLPADAVLRDSKGASVWIKTGKNTFRNKMVTIGVENDQRIQITSGLQSGDVVVTSGAYLINSEYIFKKGSDPMAGMKM